MRDKLLAPFLWAYKVVLGLGAVAGATVALFKVLDTVGVTHNQTQQVLAIPENLNRLIELGIAALQKYLVG